MKELSRRDALKTAGGALVVAGGATAVMASPANAALTTDPHAAWWEQAQQHDRIAQAMDPHDDDALEAEYAKADELENLIARTPPTTLEGLDVQLQLNTSWGITAEFRDGRDRAIFDSLVAMARAYMGAS